MIDYEEFEDYLAHYGVGHDKGGHSGRYPWGSGEKGKTRLGGSSGNSEVRRGSKGYTKQEALERGSAKDVLAFQGELSNRELQDAVTRLRLESQLKDISNEDLNKGKRAAVKVLSALGDKVAIPLIVGATSVAIKTLIERKYGHKIADSVKNVGKGQEPLSEEDQKIVNEVVEQLTRSVNPPPKKK